jgi:NADH:ubiquinone oxidoreductase subunit 3 (subunit A)
MVAIFTGEVIMGEFLLSPPFAFAFFLVISCLLYALSGALSESGQPNTSKNQPYTGGENLPPPQSGMAYQDFFWLALLFSILHVAALVLSTLHSTFDVNRMKLAYLLGIAISVFVLTEVDIS